MKIENDTIAAIATAPGEAGISIVRVSGPDSLRIADRIVRYQGAKPSDRAGNTFLHGHSHDRQGDIDEVLVLIMRGPHSYTREDMIEIQGHGGNQSAKRNLRAVLEAGARLAEPGEFTQRAFLNGRLDLAQAEAVLDLIRARSDRAAAAALEQLDGALSRKINRVYDELVALAADVEATLDFPEDELPQTVVTDIKRRAVAVQERFRELISTWDEGHLLREGAKVVIAGLPNVGKSTLLNALLGRDRAIVSETPGTTRDTIEESFVLGGVHAQLIDTAGLRETPDRVESEGIRRTRSQLAKADIFLYLMDASQKCSEEDWNHLAGLDPRRSILVLNKVDLGRRLESDRLSNFRTVETSLIRNQGVDEVRRRMSEILLSGVDPSVPPHAVISERHRKLLVDASHEMEQAIDRLGDLGEDAATLSASHFRMALDHLGAVTGRAYQDELLASIFSRFCIGK